MNEIPVHNDGADIRWVGAVMIPPGETRLIPAHQVPAHLRPQAPPAPAPARSDPVLELLDGPVRDVLAALPGLDDDVLATLRQAEIDGKTRKSLLEGIAAEELRRAEQRQRDAESRDDA